MLARLCCRSANFGGCRSSIGESKLFSCSTVGARVSAESDTAGQVAQTALGTSSRGPALHDTLASLSLSLSLERL